MAAELSLAIVLEHYGCNLRNVPSTGWHNIKCPFHADHMASAGVNLAAGGFTCHACDMSGDAVGIIMKQEGVRYAEAVEFARTVLGASVQPVPRSVSKSRKRRKLGREKWQTVLG